jgi:hypothetical protein
MDRQWIDNLNPHSGVRGWEISPCVEIPEQGMHGGETQACATLAEAEDLAEAEGAEPVFFGVYAHLRDELVQAGSVPAAHVKDFATYEEALGFVTVINGVPEVTYADNDT